MSEFREDSLQTEETFRNSMLSCVFEELSDKYKAKLP